MSDQQIVQKRNEPKLDSPESEELEQMLSLYRTTLDQAAAQTDFYWANQRKQVLEKLEHAPKLFPIRRTCLLASAAAMLFLCLFFCVGKKKSPTPDFAAGADQQLLVEVERALQQPYPEALAPVSILHDEIEAVAKRHSANK